MGESENTRGESSGGVANVEPSGASRALISRSALEHNVARAREAGEIMAIVKADAYGHGLERIARWIAQTGVSWFGVAQLEEALRLREILGPEPRILTWIYAPGAPLQRAIGAGLDISVGSPWSLDETAAAARALGQPARVHIKVDTGMARGGFSMRDLADAVPAIGSLIAEGAIEPVGLWSHLACADSPDAAVTDQQTARFEEARGILAAAGIMPQLLHLAASGGNLWHPSTHYDLTRPGIMLYGVSPNADRASAHQLGLRAVMQLESELIVTREVPAGTGVSYGHTEYVQEDSELGVVPLGYADGIPRQASSRGEVSLGSERARIVGRVCMDQFVVRAPRGTTAGQTAVVFGDAANGFPTADDWGRAADTIGYEIVTRLGPRVARISVA